MGKTVAIVQARMGSTRLPGKVLMELAGRSVLQWVLDRLGQARRLDEILIATTESPGDDAIVARCRQAGVSCFRGSETDVLGRFIAAADHVGADLVIRVNADNPLVDAAFVDELIEDAAAGDHDYLSYQLSTGRPVMLTALSFFTEAVPAASLRRAGDVIRDPFQREHVTLGIYKQPEVFRVRFRNVPGYCDTTDLRLTLDRPEDFAILEAVVGLLGPQALTAGAAAVVEAIRACPGLLDRMARLNAANVKSDRK